MKKIDINVSILGYYLVLLEKDCFISILIHTYPIYLHFFRITHKHFCSKLELTFKRLVKYLFCTVFHFKRSNSGLFGHITLNLNFGVLFPAPNVFWHLKFDFFLQESVHLSFDGVRLALGDESSSVVETCHLIKIFVSASKAAHHVELSVENVLTMTSIVHAVVHYQLNHHFLGILTME